MKNIETALGNVDFSRFSKVRTSLKESLLNKYDATRGNSQSISILGNELSDDDLDMVVAAGNPMMQNPDKPKRII